MTSTTIAPELLDQPLANYETPEDLTGNNGLFKRLKKAADRTRARRQQPRRLEFEVGSDEVPRDRAGSFDPQLIPKGQRRFDGFDDKILSLYERGMTVGEIQGHLAELYGAEVSPDLISRVTDAVLRGLGDADARHAARRQRRCVQGARHRRPVSRPTTSTPWWKSIGKLCARAWPSIAPCRASNEAPGRAAASGAGPVSIFSPVQSPQGRRAPLPRRSRCPVHQQPGRAGHSNHQGQNENLRPFRTLDAARDFARLGSIVSTTRK